MSDAHQSRKEEFEATKKEATGDKTSNEISKLQADAKGLFSLRFPKSQPDFSKEEVKALFDVAGDLADVHFTENYIFVRYKSKESAVKVFEEKKDSFDLDVPSVSKTWSAKGHDDNITAKISKLAADSRGFYSIRIAKPNAEFNEEDVENNFGEFGDIADTHFTDKFIYVRYLSWKEASNAIKGLNDKFTVDVPGISATWRPQKAHTDRGPQIYIGNISPKVSKEQIAELLEPFLPWEYKFYTINNRNFAFAYFETIQDCKRVVAALNGKVMFGSTLLVKTCRDRSRARYIADDDYHNKKAEGRKGGRGDGAQKARQPGQITELYASNFVRIVKQRDLEGLFGQYGSLAYIEMVPTPPQDCCKAFIGVYTAYDAKQMIHKLNQLKWHGLKLNVAFSTRVKKNPSYGADSHSNPVDRAHSLANKLDILLEDVLDDSEYCQQVKSVMSDLQQATREIKYQVLRGEVNKGLGLIDELLTYVESTQAQQEMMRSHQVQAFYDGYSPSPVSRHGQGFSNGQGFSDHQGYSGDQGFSDPRAVAAHLARGRGRGVMPSSGFGAAGMSQGRGRAQAWN